MSEKLVIESKHQLRSGPEDLHLLVGSWLERSYDPPECHLGQQSYTFVISILSMSLTSVSIFSLCCCSRYVSLWFRPLLKEIKQAGSRRIVLDCAPENIQVHIPLMYLYPRTNATICEQHCAELYQKALGTCLHYFKRV